MKNPASAGFFFAVISEFSAPLYVIRQLFVFYIIFFQHLLCLAQNQEVSGVWQIGLTQEFQKFNQFSALRVQRNAKQFQFGFQLGLSVQKASQQLFAPSLTFDYARPWKIKQFLLGPVLVLSTDTYFFGSRFNYLHASIGYRFLAGKKWQFFQESSLGPSQESFTYFDQKYRQFTWNYHIKFGFQYALP